MAHRITLQTSVTESIGSYKRGQRKRYYPSAKDAQTDHMIESVYKIYFMPHSVCGKTFLKNTLLTQQQPLHMENLSRAIESEFGRISRNRICITMQVMWPFYGINKSCHCSNTDKYCGENISAIKMTLSLLPSFSCVLPTLTISILNTVWTGVDFCCGESPSNRLLQKVLQWTIMGCIKKKSNASCVVIFVPQCKKR